LGVDEYGAQRKEREGFQHSPTTRRADEAYAKGEQDIAKDNGMNWHVLKEQSEAILKR
jgi:hypothetical protein